MHKSPPGGNPVGLPHVSIPAMESRPYEHSEPSHIHIPRPSRIALREEDELTPVEMIQLCALCGETGQSGPSSDIQAA
jgi:hypothetical protein